MDRIHRLGQHRPVQAIKLVVEDSIESRIVQVCFSCLTLYDHGVDALQLQEKKSDMGDATLSTDDSVSRLPGMHLCVGLISDTQSSGYGSIDARRCTSGLLVLLLPC